MILAASCTGSTLICTLNNLIEAVEGDPWSAFWLTALATLLGAVLGALASWGFALDLARRDRSNRQADRIKDEEARARERVDAQAERQAQREQERREAMEQQYRLGMTDRWVAIAESIANYQAAQSQERSSAWHTVSLHRMRAWAYAKGEDAEIADLIRQIDKPVLMHARGTGRLGGLLYMYMRGDVAAPFVLEMLRGLPQYVEEEAAAEAKPGPPTKA